MNVKGRRAVACLEALTSPRDAIRAAKPSRSMPHSDFGLHWNSRPGIIFLAHSVSPTTKLVHGRLARWNVCVHVESRLG